MYMADFNPRSHKGSDNSGVIDRSAKTNFNPRSHKGSDKNACLDPGGRSDFNPRSHKGSDVSVIEGAVKIIISIHAPTRGATPGGS